MFGTQKLGSSPPTLTFFNRGNGECDQTLLSIIIPAHNEAHRLPSLFDKIQKFIEAERLDYEVPLVKMPAQTIILKIAQIAKNLFLNRSALWTNPAKATRFRTGMLRARENSASWPMSISRCRSKNCASSSLPNMPPAGSIASREQPGSQRSESLFIVIRSAGFSSFGGSWPYRAFRIQRGFKCFSAEAAEAIFSAQTMDGCLTLPSQLPKIWVIAFGPITWYYKPTQGCIS